MQEWIHNWKWRNKVMVECLPKSNIPRHYYDDEYVRVYTDLIQEEDFISIKRKDIPELIETLEAYLEL